MIGLGIGAIVWIDSYQPIAFAGGTQLPPSSKPSPGAAGVSVVFRKGRPFKYGITIQNTGRFTVRVLGVPRSVTDFYSGRLLMSKDQTGHLDEKPLERFQPFDMKPGSFRWLVFKGVYACTMTPETPVTLSARGGLRSSRQRVYECTPMHPVSTGRNIGSTLSHSA